MPSQILPIQEISKVGVIKDTASVLLPPNGFSDALNVRFNNGSIEKLPGESDILLGLNLSDEVRYSVFWPHPDYTPNGGILVLVQRGINSNGIAGDRVHLYEVDSNVSVGTSLFAEVSAPVWNPSLVDKTHWHHAFFDGGRSLILNNGKDYPRYCTNPINGFLKLPGWDSYLVEEKIKEEFIYDGFTISLGGKIDLGQKLDLSGTDLATGRQTLVAAEDMIPGEKYRIVALNETNFNDYATNRGEINGTAGVIGDEFIAIDPIPDSVSGAVLGTVQRVGSQTILITVRPEDTNIEPHIFELESIFEPAGTSISVSFEPTTGTHNITFVSRIIDDATGQVVQKGVAVNDRIELIIRSKPSIHVRAGVIRAFGNVLVAGNLVEYPRLPTVSNPDGVVRNMPGAIRISDLAPPGAVPANWNPFIFGANTAEEILLSTTSVIQDMAQLQGQLIVYTNNSIHAVVPSGNLQIPYSTEVIAHNLGIQSIEAVQEFDGKHFIVGSNDIYIFSGHPGNIVSVADGSVREYFFNKLNPRYESNLFTLHHRAQDEIWICYPTVDSDDGYCDETLIWNYRNQTWTIRRQTPVSSGTMSPIGTSINIDVINPTVNPNKLFPLFSGTSGVFVADQTNKYSLTRESETYPVVEYESYIQRERFSVTPDLYEEAYDAFVIIGNVENQALETKDVVFDVWVAGSELPNDNSRNSEDLEVPDSCKWEFNFSESYKIDCRITDRFLNYKISDGGTDNPWKISGIQLEVTPNSSGDR